MISFVNDYSEGACPEIIKALTAHNLVSNVGYGEDEICAGARDAICRALEKKLPVHFMVGGTQTNSAVIAAILRPHEGVVSAETGHINQHETGAVEASGHKVIALPSHDGKLDAGELYAFLKAASENEIKEHIVKPGMVYLSNPTELGTLYTKKELEKLHDIVSEFGLPLFLDGARLAYGLAASKGDLTLRDLTGCTDVFYIGGTKCGAMMGEAIVFCDERLGQDFRYIQKQRGAMLAKGWLLGIQFKELFTDQLYERLGQKTITLSEKLTAGLKEIGVELYVESPTNQVFILAKEKQAEALKKDFSFEYWDAYDREKSIYRFCVSWAREEEDIRELLEACRRIWSQK